MWRLYTDEKGVDEDWYIKPNQSVTILVSSPTWLE